MVYPEEFIAPMREELTRHGVIETRTPEEVDQLLIPDSGTVLMVINSVCGCAAGSARPGVIQSLENDVRPEKVATVFAGGDVAAVARVREILSDYPPLIALRHAVSRWQADLHVASPPDRGTRSQPNRGYLARSLQPALREGTAGIALRRSEKLLLKPAPPSRHFSSSRAWSQRPFHALRLATW